jgi:hypothetical protein
MSLQNPSDVLPLDGNAAAGLLSEIFAVDITSAIVTCNGCGALAQVGAVRLYGGTMGAIFRCSECEQVVARLACTPTGFTLDMRGARGLSYVRKRDGSGDCAVAAD